MAAAGTAGAAPAQGAGDGSTTFHGARLVLAGFVLAMANFIVVLDMTIANVSIPHIAGGLAVSTQSATWVITSYAVAEAICVPLTGWFGSPGRVSSGSITIKCQGGNSGIGRGAAAGQHRLFQ